MEQKQYLLSPELAPRLAAIDIGTNSIRLIIAEGLRGGKYRVLDDEKESARLGRNLQATGRLDPEAIEVSLAALRRMKQIADGYQVQRIQTIATCAVREAQDGAEFCRRVGDEVGLEVEVISAAREAHLAFISVMSSGNYDGNLVIADIGGGSTEIVLASGNVIEQVFNTPLGAVRLAEMYQAAGSMTADRFERLLRGAERMLRKHTAKPLFVPHLLIGSGGTFTTLASLVMASRGQTGLPLRGYRVSRADVRHLLERLRKMSAKARRGVPGLSPDRADIIVAGLAIIDCLMRRFKVNALEVHDGGVRDGLLLTMVDPQASGLVDSKRDRQQALEAFAQQCGADVPHCRQVARLAGEIYRQLRAWYPLPEADEQLLMAAAQLQDVGYLINYDRHHKHSYHLILNSRLPGFGPDELELIANVARYHRGAKPKRKHANFRQLSPRDRDRVRRLAAILRLAGGFDRSHTQQVQEVTVLCEGEQLRMFARAGQLPEVDVWGAKRRAAIFEKVFGAPLRIDWLAPGQAAPEAIPSGDGSPPRAARRGAKKHKHPGQPAEGAEKTDPRERPAVSVSRA